MTTEQEALRLADLLQDEAGVDGYVHDEAAAMLRKLVAEREADRAAMRRALDALEWMSDCYVGEDDDAGECASCHERSYKPHAPDCKKHNAITDLRQRLEGTT